MEKTSVGGRWIAKSNVSSRGQINGPHDAALLRESLPTTRTRVPMSA